MERTETKPPATKHYKTQPHGANQEQRRGTSRTNWQNNSHSEGSLVGHTGRHWTMQDTVKCRGPQLVAYGASKHTRWRLRTCLSCWGNQDWLLLTQTDIWTHQEPFGRETPPHLGRRRPKPDWQCQGGENVRTTWTSWNQKHINSRHFRSLFLVCEKYTAIMYCFQTHNMCLKTYNIYNIITLTTFREYCP